jgi:uncharacterized protein
LNTDELKVAIDDRLEETGDTYVVQGHLDWTGYELGVHEMALPDGVDYDIVLTNTGDGILATGIVKAKAVGACDRCLEDAVLDIASEVDEYFLFEAPAEDELGEDEDVADFTLVGPDRTIDLGEAIHAALIMETPFVLLCKDDCKGICPHCGANLNEEACDCAEKKAQADAEEAAVNNPFAVLKNLNVEDARNNGE